MTRSKTHQLFTVVEEFSRIRFAFSLRNITSRSVINCHSNFLPSSNPPGSITPTRAHSFCHRNSKTSASKMELRPPKLRTTIRRALAKTNTKTELCGLTFSACCNPQTAHSLTGKVSYNQSSCLS